MRLSLRLLASVVVLMFVVAAPAAAQEPIFTEEDAELAEQLEAELLLIWGITGNQGADLVGVKGKLDLDPGTATLQGVVLSLDSAPLPNGGSSYLTGGCQGIALSFDANGELIDAAADFDPAGPPIDLLSTDLGASGGPNVVQAFTESNPFEVHVNGFVAYAGRATPDPINHRWQITTFGQAIDSGGDPNPRGRNRNAGTVNLKEDLPGAAKLNGLFEISGDMQINESTPFCEGSGYFRTVGGSEVLAGAGLIVVFLAGLGAFFNARPAVTWKG